MLERLGEAGHDSSPTSPDYRETSAAQESSADRSTPNNEGSQREESGRSSDSVAQEKGGKRSAEYVLPFTSKKNSDGIVVIWPPPLQHPALPEGLDRETTTKRLKEYDNLFKVKKNRPISSIGHVFYLSKLATESVEGVQGTGTAQHPEGCEGA